MALPELPFASIAELAPRLARRELSPVEVTEAVLARIEQYNDVLKAYITVTADSARHAARAAEAAILAGHYLGPLHGIPVAVKDLFATRGVRTTFGSPLFADWVPDFDAAAVERLKRAGAVIVGKTNLHELAFGTTSANPHFGAVRNPWQTQCHPGGSSGGSAAAVAAGLAFGALGSDTGASIRQPAACCGIVGLKPTYGLVSKFGALPLSWSMDHVGPMTRTVADAALLLQVLAGYDSRDATSVACSVPDYTAALQPDLRGLRLGVARDFFFAECDPEVVAAVEAALPVLRELGAAVEEVVLPDMAAARAAGTVILFAEAAAYHAANLRQRPQAFSDEVRALLEMGQFYTAVQYVQAQRLRRQLTAATCQALAGFDAVVMPTAPLPATPIAPEVPGHAALRPRNTLPFDFTGLPALSVPCGLTRAGLPVGLQIVGKPFAEATVLRVAYAYEQATPWHRQRPPL
ncbi:MAG: glutamyl-tRNA(Gln) amidotransferase subunit A [Candidatus Tectimicrobiota bacterium]|nr:MAG: glutamyl-tRNA(Gln) amidotransferase subunit A [Candidatus Tectomicrobia bacterium]